MNLRKSVLSFLVLFAVAITSAFSLPTSVVNSPDKSVNLEIAQLIMKIDFNTEEIVPGTVAKLKFMVNEKNEVIVLTTGNELLDSTLKSALNYKTISASDLETYKVYVVPISFKK